MNLTALKATLTRNKTALLGVAGAVVVGLALRSRSKAKAAGTTAADPSGASATPSYYTAGNPASTGAAYDSSSSDVYNALQPELEKLQQLYSTIPVPGTSTTPAPAPSWTASETDPRRQAIISDYQSELGRDPARSEVNFWDNGGRNLTDIHALIGQGAEAQAAK